VISAWPVTDGVYVTLHVPEDRVQLVALKVPVLLLVNVTVPVGVLEPAPAESATVTVQVVVPPELTVAGLHETVVVVDRSVDARVKVPLLPE